MNGAIKRERIMVVGAALEPEIQAFGHQLLPYARLINCNLHFIHVVEPWDAANWQAYYPSSGTGADFMELIERARFEDAQQKLHQYLNADGKPAFDASIVRGEVAQGLIETAEARQAQMLVCGLHHQSYTLLPQGFSTTLSVIAQSRLPVLAMPQHARLNATGQEPFTILVADSLDEGGQRALGFVGQLVREMSQNVRILHVHVSQLKESQLDFMAGLVADTLHARKHHLTPTLRFDEIMAMTDHGIREKLSHRSQPLGLVHTDRVAFEQIVLFGDVVDELQDLVKFRKPDLLVFGRHRMLHRKPFGIGKLPFTSMIRHQLPVLIVPPPD